LLAAQTTLGAAAVVLKTGDHPALLKDAVTTPAGCTIDGILELEEGKIRVILIKAVVRAAERARELAHGRPDEPFPNMIITETFETQGRAVVLRVCAPAMPAAQNLG
jgi:hypothetical protein